MGCQNVPCHAWQNGVNSKSVMTCTSMLDVKIIMALIIMGQRQLKCKNLERKLSLIQCFSICLRPIKVKMVNFCHATVKEI